MYIGVLYFCSALLADQFGLLKDLGQFLSETCIKRQISPDAKASTVGPKHDAFRSVQAIKGNRVYCLCGTYVALDSRILHNFWSQNDFQNGRSSKSKQATDSTKIAQQISVLTSTLRLRNILAAGHAHSNLEFGLRDVRYAQVAQALAVKENWKVSQCYTS